MMKNLLNTTLSIISCTKSMITWFHSAHHVTKGSSFSGDHVNLFGEIYNEIIGDFDALVEKAIVLCDSEEVACPIEQTRISSNILKSVSSPVGLHEDQIAMIALDMIRMHLKNLNSYYDYLESENALSLGMDDHLAAAANTYEKFEYLLGQRVKRGTLWTK